jgi:hypothetical protein
MLILGQGDLTARRGREIDTRMDLNKLGVIDIML